MERGADVTGLMHMVYVCLHVSCPGDQLSANRQTACKILSVKNQLLKQQQFLIVPW